MSDNSKFILSNSKFGLNIFYFIYKHENNICICNLQIQDQDGSKNTCIVPFHITRNFDLISQTLSKL